MNVMNLCLQTDMQVHFMDLSEKLLILTHDLETRKRMMPFHFLGFIWYAVRIQDFF